MVIIDLKNKTFGRLTVLERAENNKQGQPQWLCQCNCEGENSLKVIKGSSLRSGHTKSCGCLQREKIKEISQISKNHNTYDLSGEYGVGWTFKKEKFWFDLEDYNKIKNYSWHFNKDGYIVTGYNKILMHRIIMNCPDDMEVDHIFHKKFDCRKEFLRIVTPSQNQMNRRIQSNNTSGIKGVVWREDKEKWRAYITINNKHIHLGYFNIFNEAVEVRKQAEIEYFGEYRYINT